MLREIVAKFVRPKECKAPEAIETIERLKALESALDFRNFSAARAADPTIVDLLVKSGAAESHWLYDAPEISVARTVFADGAELPGHVHEQFEAWVVFKGYLEVTIDGARVDAIGKRVFYVYPGSVHSVRAIGETEIIVVSIPRSDNFPRQATRNDD